VINLAKNQLTLESGTMFLGIPELPYINCNVYNSVKKAKTACDKNQLDPFSHVSRIPALGHSIKVSK